MSGAIMRQSFGQRDIGELPVELAGIGAGRVQEQDRPAASGALDMNLGCTLRQGDPMVAPFDLAHPPGRRQGARAAGDSTTSSNSRSITPAPGRS